MMFFAEWNVILFLCSPIMNDIASLQFAGLFINDLAMHDFSRDLLLTGKKYFMADILVWHYIILQWIIFNECPKYIFIENLQEVKNQMI